MSGKNLVVQVGVMKISCHISSKQKQIGMASSQKQVSRSFKQCLKLDLI